MTRPALRSRSPGRSASSPPTAADRAVGSTVHQVPDGLVEESGFGAPVNARRYPRRERGAQAVGKPMASARAHHPPHERNDVLEERSRSSERYAGSTRHPRRPSGRRPNPQWGQGGGPGPRRGGRAAGAARFRAHDGDDRADGEGGGHRRARRGVAAAFRRRQAATGRALVVHSRGRACQFHGRNVHLGPRRAWVDGLPRRPRHGPRVQEVLAGHRVRAHGRAGAAPGAGPSGRGALRCRPGERTDRPTRGGG